MAGRSSAKRAYLPAIFHLFLGIYQPEALFFHFFKLIIHSQTFYCQEVFLARMAGESGYNILT